MQVAIYFFSLGVVAQDNGKGRGYRSVTKMGCSGPAEKVGPERRSARVFADVRRSVPEDRMASARVLLDEQSFSPCRRDAAAESGGWDEVVAGNLHAAI